MSKIITYRHWVQKLSVIFLSAAFLLTGVNLAFSASGETLNVDEYQFNISADQSGSTLSVRGRISGGDSCSKLTANIFLHTDDGNIAHVTVIINNYSGNSRFSVKEEASDSRSRWKVSNVFVDTYE